jgi:NhaP-type Na+/H+ or K+/H+ antiporter
LYAVLAILAATVLIYGAVAGRLERTPVSGAIVFVSIGFLLGPVGLGALELTVDTGEIRLLAELTLAMVLFVEAADADLGVLRRSFRIPTRMLAIGLPLTIALGFALGVPIFPDLTLLEVALLATMLAPTDAALGKAVVTNPDVPPSVREGLKVEAGLNDGICVPVLLAFLAIAGGSVSSEDSTIGLALGLFAREIGIGAVVAAEATGDTLTLLTWIVFGAVVIDQALPRFGWDHVAYAVLSLTVIRMLPMFLSLTGLSLGTDGKLFVGWFGPRGLVSIVFAIIVLDADVPGGDSLAMTVICTVVLSILAHGLSAVPLARIYGARVGKGTAIDPTPKDNS